ncbi:MAG TPA: hypothetical protein VMF11_13895 [Candidatus Baltobacteraceae bacterium]|nr:hypothetical protein [Candidatus Baltobacteraceae bacterium]
MLVVSSAAALGYGALRAFEESAGWTAFGPPEIADPRGVRRRADDPYLLVNDPIAGVWLLDFDGAVLAQIALPAGLDPGGGAFAPDGTYYVGSRAQRSIERVDLTARRYAGRALALEGIAFPRGFAVLEDGGFVVASGTHPVRGGGRRALFRYDRDGKIESDAFVDDRLLDPLDLAVRDGSIYVTSEAPFGAEDAVVSLRRYDARTGAAAGAWSAQDTPVFGKLRKPRGITFAQDGTLLLCAQNGVVAVDVATFGRARFVAEDDRLAGQSLALTRAIL